MRFAIASELDHNDPALALVSQTGGASTPPTSFALTQPGPASLVLPSPPYWTNSQSGRLSTCFSRLHCGSRVNRVALSFGPERSGVSV